MSSKSFAGRALSQNTVELLRTLESHGGLKLRQLAETKSIDLTTTQLRGRLQHLRQAGYVAFEPTQGYQLTTEGTQRLDSLHFSFLQPEQPWDGKWRVIMFDIPESNRLARDAIRRLVKQLGCQQLQLSVWVHPLPCLEQFKQLQKSYGLTEHIRLLEVSWLDNQQQLLTYFRRLYPDL